MDSILNEYLVRIASLLLIALFGWLGTQAKNLYKKYVTTQIADDCCRDAVRFVEQIYRDIHGHEKLEKALEVASKLLEEKGITISEYTMEKMIEAAVNEFNDQFNKNAVYHIDVPADK